VLVYRPLAAQLISGEISSVHSGVIVDVKLSRLRAAFICRVKQASDTLLDPEGEGNSNLRNVNNNVPRDITT
jgi:hypothetical protein